MTRLVPPHSGYVGSRRPRGARTFFGLTRLIAIAAAAWAAPAGGAGTSHLPPRFEQVSFASGDPFTSLVVGPDRRLYAGTLDGLIFRYDLAADGTMLRVDTIRTLQQAEGGPRALIGMAFDPGATAEDPVLWITHSGAPLTNSADWLGKISRLSGAGLDSITDYVIELPRSTRDHMTNGIAFGPDGALYVCQGSNTAMGAPNAQWGNRPERLLSAAVLRVDVDAILSPPLDVKTEAGGTYDPFLPGAPLTLYASGVRNAYDLVWHSNGRLYVPVNGSTSGGHTPATPDPLPPDCATHRVDLATNGPYIGPQVPALANIAQVQNDYLFRIEPDGYYGHPNPTRCEWVANGGDPTAGADSAEVTDYPQGTLPDRNWRRYVYDFGLHQSPDGIIEYHSQACGAALAGRLLVARYSTGNDIIALSLEGASQDSVVGEIGIQGFTGFTDPLDLAEDSLSGRLYVADYGARRIFLLRPLCVPPTDVVAGGAGTPTSGIQRVAPNPVRGAAMIRYFTAVPGPASLEVFDIRGRLVRALARGTHAAGPHSVRWDGRSRRGAIAEPGVYYLRLVAPDRAASLPIAVLR